MSQIKRRFPSLELEAALGPPPPAASIFSRPANLGNRMALAAFRSEETVRSMSLASPEYWRQRAEKARAQAERIRTKNVKKRFTLERMSDRVGLSDRVALAVLATGIGAMSAATVAVLLRGMTLHDQRLVLLIASMLVALYALFRDDERLILLTLGALVALYVPFVAIG